MALLDKIETKLEAENANYLTEYRDQIKRYLKLELAEKYYGRKGYSKYSVENDPQITTAISVLNNHTKYNKILAVN